MITFDYDEVDAELARSLHRFCGDTVVSDPSTPLAREYWEALAELGVLGLATPEGGGGVTTIAAAMEELGRANASGPLVATFVAMQLLDDVERGPVAAGEHLVAVGVPPLMPWLPLADVVIEIDGTDAHLASVSGEVDCLDTLGDEPWGRAQLVRGRGLGDAGRALAIGNVAMAAYLVGNATHLLEHAASYVGDRVQFRKPISSFQAVSHPLADCYVRLTAARTLARGAAYELDDNGGGAPAAAATARLSAARAAMSTAFQCHQAYGAVGFTVEGPVGIRSARIRQLSSLLPGDGQLRELAMSAYGAALSDH